MFKQYSTRRITINAKDFAVVALCIILLGFACAVGVVGCVGCTVWNKAEKEFGIDASLKKYEEFKDISAKLEAKLASIKVANERVKSLEKTYDGIPRKDWPRDERGQYNVWVSEVSGMKTSYNQLAADYNSRMAKFNYSFANVGDLPKGATVPLPRDYKPYEDK